MQHHVDNWQISACVIIFLFTYAIIITEKINRAVIALLGAVAMLVLQIVDTNTAFTSYIEWNTISEFICLLVLIHR